MPGASVLAAWTALALLGPAIPEDRPSDADLAAYRAARDAAGRDADAQVRLALWCERHGLTAERLRHLGLALLADPQHAAARALMGLARDLDGQWRRPSEVARRVQADPQLTATLGEYERRRAAALDTADDHWDLAAWCDQNGLPDQARAHYASVVRLDPTRDAAWRRLGCRKVGNRWLTDAQVAAEKAEKAAQEKADRRWRATLTRWKDQLSDDRKRADAEANLDALTEPRAVPSVLKVFGRSDPARCLQLLGQIDSPDSSRALAFVSVFGRTDELRRGATEVLRRRDPREFAGLLIALIRQPIRYEVRPVGGPGSPGVLFVEGKRFNVRRVYNPPPAPSAQPGDRFVGFDAFGLPIVARGFGPTAQTGFVYPYGPSSGDLTGLGLNVLGQLTAAPTPGPPTAGEVRARDLLNQAGVPAPAGQALIDTARRQQAMSQAFANDPSGLFALQGLGELGSLPNLDGTDFFPINPATGYSFVVRQQALVPLGQMQAEARKAALSSQQQLEADVAAIEAYNTPVLALNERALGALQAVTGLDLGPERGPWETWYVDQLGYRHDPDADARGAGASTPRTIVHQIPPSYEPQPVPILGTTAGIVGYRRISCFGAGTPVHTLIGPRPIESVQVGDLVLSQDPAAGGLSYQPVLAVHHNPPSATLAVRSGDETVVASTFHRFWQPGRGWVMARDLQPGDPLRTLSGRASVDSVEPGQIVPVFNLDVAGGRTFFVGRSGLLVHDNSLPDPRAVPFDHVADLAAAPAP